jgi:adenylate kinase family enzyme
MFVITGFPRSVPQAKALHNNFPADIVLNLAVPFEVIIERIQGRWVHAPTGRIYHTEFNPPKRPVLFVAIPYKVLQELNFYTDIYHRGLMMKLENH